MAKSRSCSQQQSLSPEEAPQQSGGGPISKVAAAQSTMGNQAIAALIAGPAGGTAAAGAAGGTAAAGAAGGAAQPYDAFVQVKWSCALRSSPDKNPDKPHANTIADLKPGTLIQVVGESNGWAEVNADVNGEEKHGWISRELVLKQGEDGSIPKETVSKHITDGRFGWDSKYDIWAMEQTVYVRLRVKVTPGTGVTQDQVDKLVKTWEKAEDKWSGQFSLVDSADAKNKYAVSVDFQFVDKDQHRDVTVRPGPARSNLSKWDTEDDKDAASHELGHALGQVDEYADARSPGRTITDEGSIMHTNTGEVQKGHYQDFADWLGTKKTSTFLVK